MSSKRVLEVASGATLIGLCVVGCSTTTQPASSPTSLGGVASSSASAPVTGAQELTVKSLELPSSLTPEQLGVAFVQDRMSAWEMAGATDANTTAWHQAPNLDAFTLGLAQKNADTFSEALFVPGWQADPALAKFVDDQRSFNAGSTENFFKTNHLSDDEKMTFPGDKAPYNRSIAVDPADVKVLSQSPDSVTVAVTATEHDNANQNRVGNVLKGPEGNIDGLKYHVQITFKIVNGTAKISSLH